MWILWLLIVVVVFLAFGQMIYGNRGPWRGDGPGQPRESARELLDKRFARGELTRDQYEEMKRALEQ